MDDVSELAVEFKVDDGIDAEVDSCYAYDERIDGWTHSLFYKTAHGHEI